MVRMAHFECEDDGFDSLPGGHAGVVISGHAYGQMVLDAVDELALDARNVSPAEAKRHGKIGGQITKLRIKREMEGRRMPKSEARNIWMNPLITGPEALAQMTGWTQASAYRILKKRKLAKGRPRKDEKPKP